MHCLFILFFLAGGTSIWCGGFQCESINLLDYWKHISCDVSLITTFQYFNLILHIWPFLDLRKFDFLCVHNCIRNCQIFFFHEVYYFIQYSILQLRAWLPSLWTGVRLRVTLLWYKPCCFSNVNYFVIMLTRYWSLSQHGQLQPHSKSKAWQLST